MFELNLTTLPEKAEALPPDTLTFIKAVAEAGNGYQLVIGQGGRVEWRHEHRGTDQELGAVVLQWKPYNGRNAWHGHLKIRVQKGVRVQIEEVTVL